MRVLVITLFFLVLINGILLFLLNFHLIEYIFFTQFNVSLNSFSNLQQTLFSNFSYEEYKYFILTNSVIIVFILLYLLHYNFYSTTPLITLLICSIINISFFEPSGYLNDKIWSFLYDDKIKIEYYGDGKVKTIEPLENGIRKSFFIDGTLESIINIVNSLKQGDYISFTNHGELSDIITYDKNVILKHKSFYKNGETFFEYTFEDKKVVEEKYFYKNGVLETLIVKKPTHDSPYGFKKGYYENGKLLYYALLDKDGWSVDKCIWYDKDGNKLCDSEIKEKL